MFVLRCLSVVGVAMAFALPALAADDFIAECKKGAAVPDVDKTCTCMSGKITGADRDPAIAGMKKMNASMAPGGTPLDPSTLPADQQKGLQAVMGAQTQCM